MSDAVGLELPSETGEPRTLPVRIGVLGDFAGDAPGPGIRERRFVPVTDLAAAFAAIRPELRLTIPDENGEPRAFQLRFAQLDDFSAGAIRDRCEAPARPEPSPGVAAGSMLDQILGADEPSTSPSGPVEQVLGHERFQCLRAAWLGLAHVASRCTQGVEPVMLSASPQELLQDLDQAPDLEHAALFRRLYSDAYERPDGVPITALVCDQAFSTHPQDVELLRYLATVAAEAQTPVIGSAAPALFCHDWRDFAPLSDGTEAGRFARLLSGPQHAGWRSLRESDLMRFVTLVLPRWRPRGAAAGWIQGAHVLGGQLADAYARHGWPAALCAADPAGSVESECALSDSDCRGLLESGLAPLAMTPAGGCRVGAAVALHKPPKYQDDSLTALARAMATTPYVLASSRLHQHLLCLARGRSHSPRLAGLLTAWLSEYRAEGSAAPQDPQHPVVLEGTVEVSDGYVSARVRPAYQLPPLNGTAKITLPLP